MNKYRNFIITTLYLWSLNIIFIILLYKSISIDNIFFYLLESIGVSAFINLVSEFFKDKTKKVFLLIIYSFITLLYIAQFIHFNFYDCFFSIYSLVHGSQVFGFVPAIIKVMINHIPDILILIALLITIIITIIKTNDENSKNKKLVLLIVFILNILITIGLIYIPSDNIYSRKNLLNNANLETKNVQNFGLMSSMSIDLYRFIFGPNYKLVIEENNNTYDSINYNVLNTNFSINTDDKELIMLNKYLKNEKPTKKNEYTGIFKNKNLIFITAESFSFSLVDKELTPTLYKMVNEGLNFTNFYTPIYYASTSDGEYTNLTGLLPREGTWSYQDIKNKDFPYTYSSVFKKDNYSLHGYHNGVYTFYDRDQIMPSLGYNYIGCGNGLEKHINCKLWPQSDDEMITKTFKDYKDSNKFHTYYMSISGHLYHNFTENDMAIKYKDKVKDLKYSEATKAYISANIDLDKALEHLLNNLEKSNKLNDTVIVLVPDHFPYGLSKKEYSELRKIDTIYDKHKSNLIIYNPTLKNKTINKYASNIDILPTLLNMFGVSYDSRLLIGKDIMSDDDGIVMFNDHSYLTKDGFYNEQTNKFTSFNKVSPGFVKEKQKEVLNKFNASSLILEKNYYKYLK